MNPLDVMAQLLGVDRRVGGFVLAGLGLLAASAIFISWRIEPAVAVNVSLTIAGMAVAAIVLSRIHGAAATLLAWLLVLLVSAYAVLFAAQTLCESCLRPPLMQAGCFPDPFQRGCPLAPLEPATDGAGAGTSVVAPPAISPPAISPPAISPPAISPPAIIPPAVAPPAATPGDAAPGDARGVFIHFAGSMTRESVIATAQALKALGWPVEDAGSGGERIASAFGLNEVRYFHPEDAALAQKLARDLGEVLGVGATPPATDVSRLRLRAARGHLEIWISRR